MTFFALTVVAAAVVGYSVTRPHSNAIVPIMADQGTIKIGAFLPITGDAAPYGQPIQKGAILAAEDINAHGGINGKRVEIIFEDSKCSGQEAAIVTQKLINIDHVAFILGGACSSEVLAAAPIVNEQHVVLISPGASSPDITAKGGDYVFRVHPSDALAGTAAARYIHDRIGGKRVAIIAENTDYAQALRGVFSRAITQAGGELVVDESYNAGVLDFRTQALKIKAANPDAMYIAPQVPAAGLAIVQALKEQGITQPIFTSDILVGDDIAKTNKTLLEGVIGFDPAFDDQSVGAQSMIIAYKKRFQEDLAYPYLTANGYSTIFLAKDLIARVGDNGIRLQAAAATLTQWSGGALKDISFDQYGDVVWKTYNIKQVKDGKVEKQGVLSL